MSVLNEELIEKNPAELNRPGLIEYYEYLMIQKRLLLTEFASTKKKN